MSSSSRTNAPFQYKYKFQKKYKAKNKCRYKSENYYNIINEQEVQVFSTGPGCICALH